MITGSCVSPTIPGNLKINHNSDLFKFSFHLPEIFEDFFSQRS